MTGDDVAVRVFLSAVRTVGKVEIAFDPRIEDSEEHRAVLDEIVRGRVAAGPVHGRGSLRRLGDGLVVALERAVSDGRLTLRSADDLGRESPVHEHDCDICTFLGHARGVDLWYHPQVGTGPRETVIARRGPDGDYKSGLPLAAADPDLWAARVLAEARGMLHETTNPTIAVIETGFGG